MRYINNYNYNTLIIIDSKNNEKDIVLEKIEINGWLILKKIIK